jgi:hypothetical protein
MGYYMLQPGAYMPLQQPQPLQQLLPQHGMGGLWFQQQQQQLPQQLPPHFLQLFGCTPTDAFGQGGAPGPWPQQQQQQQQQQRQQQQPQLQQLQQQQQQQQPQQQHPQQQQPQQQQLQQQQQPQQQQLQGFGSCVAVSPEAWPPGGVPAAPGSPGPSNAVASAGDSLAGFPHSAPHSPTFPGFPSASPSSCSDASNASLSPPIGFLHPSDPFGSCPTSPIAGATPASPTAVPDRPISRIQLPEYPWAEPEHVEGVAARQMMLNRRLQVAYRQQQQQQPAPAPAAAPGLRAPPRSRLGPSDEELAAQAEATAVAMALTTLMGSPHQSTDGQAAVAGLEELPARISEWQLELESQQLLRMEQMQQAQLPQPQPEHTTPHPPAPEAAHHAPAGSELPSAAAAAATAALQPPQATGRRASSGIDEVTASAAAAAATAALLASEHGPVKRAPYTLAMFWPTEPQAAAASEQHSRRAARRNAVDAAAGGGQQAAKGNQGGQAALTRDGTCLAVAPHSLGPHLPPACRRRRRAVHHLGHAPADPDRRSQPLTPLATSAVGAAACSHAHPFPGRCRRATCCRCCPQANPPGSRPVRAPPSFTFCACT